jgi:lysophospholipase L1-like esterase
MGWITITPTQRDRKTFTRDTLLNAANISDIEPLSTGCRFNYSIPNRESISYDTALSVDAVDALIQASDDDIEFVTLDVLGVSYVRRKTLGDTDLFGETVSITLSTEDLIEGWDLQDGSGHAYGLFSYGKSTVFYKFNIAISALEEAVASPFPTADLTFLWSGAYDGNDLLNTKGANPTYVSGTGLDAIYDFSVLNDERLDKSNATYWGSTLNAYFYYDALNPYHYKLKDFAYRELQAQFETDVISNCIFLKAVGSETSNGVAEVNSLLIYSTPYTKAVCQTSGTIYKANTQAYGLILDAVLNKGADGNTLDTYPICDNTTLVNHNGYRFVIASNESILLRRVTNGSDGTLFATSAAYVNNNQDYRYLIWRNEVEDEFVTGGIGTFAVYIQGKTKPITETVYETPNTDEMELMNAPVLDNNHTTNSFSVFNLDTDDSISNLKNNGENETFDTFTEGTGTYIQLLNGKLTGENLTKLRNYIGVELINSSYYYSDEYKQIISGVEEIVSSGTGLSSRPNEYRGYLLNDHRSRIRQTGYITRFSVYVNSLSDITEFYFQIWRRSGTTYTKIHDVNVISKLTAAQTNDVLLDTALFVQEGDFIGFEVFDNSGSDTQVFISVASSESDSTFYQNAGVTQVPSPQDWDASKTGELAFIIPCECYMLSPTITGIGDSLMAGHTSNYSFIEEQDINNIESQILYQLNENLVYQNLGDGGKNTTEIYSQFQRALDTHPDYMIINGGVNDLADGDTNETIISNIVNMIDDCNDNNIYPVWLQPFPWTNGTTEQMQQMDLLKPSIVSELSGKRVVIVDCTDELGVERIGEGAGNKWDINILYDVGDGIHLNIDGYTLVANLINNFISYPLRKLFF